MKNSKYLEATKTTTHLQTAAEETIQTTEKVKKGLVFFFTLMIGLSFFLFEFVNDFSEEYMTAIKNHSIEKKKRTKALNKVKEYAKETEIYKEYIITKTATDLAYSKYNEMKKEEKFFGFKSFHFFIARFGSFFGFFCYALFNLFRSFYFDRKNIGVKVIHGFILSVCIFYFYWIFQPFQDLSKMSYYLMTFASSVFVILAVYLITKYQDHRINRLKKSQYELAKFTFINTKPEKREEMLNTIERTVKGH